MANRMDPFLEPLPQMMVPVLDVVVGPTGEESRHSRPLGPLRAEQAEDHSILRLTPFRLSQIRIKMVLESFPALLPGPSGDGFRNLRPGGVLRTGVGLNGSKEPLILVRRP